jgi:hypothetical protein
MWRDINVVEIQGDEAIQSIAAKQTLNYGKMPSARYNLSEDNISDFC